MTEPKCKWAAVDHFASMDLPAGSEPTVMCGGPFSGDQCIGESGCTRKEEKNVATVSTQLARAAEMANTINDRGLNWADEGDGLTDREHDLLITALQLLAATDGRMVCMNCGSSPPAGVMRCDCTTEREQGRDIAPDFRARLDSPLRPGDRLPGGLMVVPVEPTEAMLVAGCKADDPIGRLVDWRQGDCTTREAISRVYCAVLDAVKQAGGNG